MVGIDDRRSDWCAQYLPPCRMAQGHTEPKRRIPGTVSTPIDPRPRRAADYTIVAEAAPTDHCFWGGVRCGRLPAMTMDPNDTTEPDSVAGSLPGRPHLRSRASSTTSSSSARWSGLAFTLSLPPELRIALLTKGVPGESNTRHAGRPLRGRRGGRLSCPACRGHAGGGSGAEDAEAVARLVESAGGSALVGRPRCAVRRGTERRDKLGRERRTRDAACCTPAGTPLAQRSNGRW